MRRSDRIRSAVALLLSVVLLLSSLASCSGPNLEGLSGDELRTYTAMKTENFEVTGSMFAYYFFTFGPMYVSNITEEELSERGFDENKPLKKQKYDSNRTWYDYICEYVVSEIENTLVWCEAALDAGITLTEDDYAYVNETLTNERVKTVLYYNTDYATYLNQAYFGYVNEEDVTKVMLMETLVAKYDAYLETLVKENMTQERVDAHVATMTGELDTTLTRNLAHIFVSYESYDEDQAYENIKTAKTKFEEQGKTDAAFESLWKEYSMDANMIYENVAPGEMVTAMDEWLYTEGRAVGDLGIVSSDDGCHLLYYISVGDPVYIATAKQELTPIIAAELMAQKRAEIKITKKKNVLNAIDI